MNVYWVSNNIQIIVYIFFCFYQNSPKHMVCLIYSIEEKTEKLEIYYPLEDWYL